MVAATYDAAMVRVFADEGGYGNDPKDPGGPTNFGITIIDARKYWKPNASAEDVRNMPKTVAANIYRAHYATPMRYDDLPAGFDYSVLDAAINSGVGRAPLWAGKALGIAARSIDDVVAPANAANDKVALIQRYWNVRLAFLKALATWSHFGLGWGRRVANGEAAAVRMWLTLGAALPAAEIKNKMTAESARAATAAKKVATGAATTAAAPSVAVPAAAPNFFELPAFGQVLFALGILAIIVAIMILVRRAILHSQRATAYATV